MEVKKHIYYLLVVGIFSLSSLFSTAQVTIGSAKAPVPGALLQLKENEEIGANSKHGLGLPRVLLKQLTSLGDLEIGLNAEEHIGLIIYSSQSDFCGNDYIYQGLYVWMGDKWDFLGQKVKQSPDVHIFTDSRDGVEYRYRDFGPIAGTWMLDDMRATEYDGAGTDPILSGIAQSSPHPKKQYVYPAPTGDGLDPLFFNKQPAIGILYSWAAAINSGTGGVFPLPNEINEGEDGTNSTEVRQGICPQGWHVPSDKEWNDIESVIAQNPAITSTNTGTVWDDAWRTTKAIRPSTDETNGHSRSMKIACLPMAAVGGSPTNGECILPDEGGFNIMLVGDLLDNAMVDFGKRVSFWSSSSSSSGAAWARTFHSVFEGVQRSDYNRSRLYSVRCKMDDPTP